jgi:hypothetical protein
MASFLLSLLILVVVVGPLVAFVVRKDRRQRLSAEGEEVA